LIFYHQRIFGQVLLPVAQPTSIEKNIYFYALIKQSHLSPTPSLPAQSPAEAQQTHQDTL
jgi:hypothetical protein